MGNCCQCGKKRESNELERVPSYHEVLLNQNVNPMSLEEVETHYKNLKNIYAYCFDAMQNFIGMPCYPFITQPKQLYPYILYLCEDLENHQFVAIKEVVSCKQLVNVQLTVVVKEANVIHPKITEFSRIFCKLWISSGKEQLTSVKEAPSILLWDETFILDVEDYECDIFHIEVWSSRPGRFENLTAFNFESLKEDDPLAEENGIYFLGDAAEYVKSLPCVGQNMLWTLKKGPRRVHIKGQINIFMELNTKKGQDYILHFHCHMAIIRLCYEKQLVDMKEESSDLWRNWLEILPNTALTLIQQHALQHGITPLEQSLCSWLVTCSLKMRLEDRISFYLLRDLLVHLFENITEDSIREMQEVFCKSLSEFAEYTLEQLRDLHKNFDVQSVEKADELYYMLRCMNTVELKMCSSNFVEAYQIIEDEASVWYLKIIADVKKDLEIDYSILTMGERLKDIMKIYLRNQILLDDVFNRAWNISYSSITYKKLDDVVYTTIQPMIKHLMVMLEGPERKRKISESLKMLQLYHNVRNLFNYIVNCIPSKSILRMDEYSVWFGEEMVLEWFLLCDIYTQPFIQRAVLADSMEHLSKGIVHGTSVPDVAAIIDEMVIDVWMKLKWKDQFYTHGALIEAVKSCVLVYAKVILERILLDRFYCPAREFQVTDKLCVALSNVFAISAHLDKTKKRVRNELRTAESTLGFKISDPLIVVQSELQITTADILLLLFEKIYKRIKWLIKQTAKSEIASMQEETVANNNAGLLGRRYTQAKTNIILTSSLLLSHTIEYSIKKGSADLCSYIDNSLEVLYCNLKLDAFHILLRQMWIVLLKSFKMGLKYGEGWCVTRKRRLNIYMITLQTLNQMKNIFFCDGHGLSHYEMDNKICEELKCSLEATLQAK